MQSRPPGIDACAAGGRLGEAPAGDGVAGEEPLGSARPAGPPVPPRGRRRSGAGPGERTGPGGRFPLLARDRRAASEPRAAGLADVPPHLRRLGLQSAGPDHAGQRRLPPAGVDILHRLRPRSSGAAHRQRRTHVRHHPTGHRRPSGARARRGDRRSVVALRAGPAGGCPQAPRQGEPRRRPVRRQGLHGDRGRGRGRAGRGDRRGRLGPANRGPGCRSLRHDGAAHRRREGHGRGVGRRVRYTRLRRRARRRHRTRGVEDVHRPRARRAGGARPGPARRGARAARRCG